MDHTDLIIPDEHMLGEIAYNAYCENTDWKSAVTGASLPKFKDTSPLIQQSWIKSATAVVDSIEGINMLIIKNLITYNKETKE